jgi:hypothetical protein
MNRKFTVFGGLLIGSLLFGTGLIAHDEPPKTEAEQKQKERVRSGLAEHRVKMQHAWQIIPEKASRPADSMLLLSNHFDPQGNPIEQVVIDSSGATRTINTFGEKNVWLEELTYFGDSLDDRTVFVYNPQGLILQVLSFDIHGTITGKLDYSYHDSTNEIIAVKHDASGALQYTIVYSYQSGSRFLQNIRSIQTKADGSLMVKVEIQFEGERRSGKKVYDAVGALNRTFAYQYTPSGDYLSISTLSSDGTLLSRQEYHYSEDGLLARISTVGANGEIIKQIHYHYEYFKESHNNG